MHYLISCSIVKNEDDYILDFIEYNKFMGIEHFIFYDRSTIPLSETLKGRTDVTIINFPEPNRHTDAWFECLKNFQGFSKWCMFFDIDQFIMIHHHNDMKVLLQGYEKFGALGINWLTFGDNGHIKKPEGSQFKNFTKRNKLEDGVNVHVQSCVQLDRAAIVKPGDPHHFQMKRGQVTVNEKFIPFDGPFSKPPSGDLINLAHFYTRSHEEWSNKVLKNRADTGTAIDNNFFYAANTSCNEVEDFSIYNTYKKMKGIE